MSSGRNIFDGLNAASKAGVQTAPSARFRTRDVPLASIYRNEDNHYSLTDVDKLAKDILLAGRLYHNLVLVYDPTPAGEYRLISGERRWLALQQLVREGHTEFATVTAQILPKSTPEQERLAIILANAQREKTAADRVQEYEGIKAALEKMRAKGQDLYGRDLRTGRLRDVIAEITEEATGTLATLEKISTNLIPELRQLLDQGCMGYMTAADAASLSPEQQRALACTAGEQITRKDVRAQADAEKISVENLEKKYETVICPAAPERSCNNGHNLASLLQEGSMSGCPGCCCTCEKATSCEKCCDVVKNAAGWTGGEPVDFGTQLSVENEEFRDDAVARHAESLCYKCGHWGECSEKSDRVLTCDKFKNAHAREAEPVSTVDTIANDERKRGNRELLQLLMTVGIDGLHKNERITDQEAEQLYQLLKSMWTLWVESGNGE